MGCNWRKYSGGALSLFSNSYGLDSGASSPARGSNVMAAAALDVTLDNHSVSGGMVPDVTGAIYAKAVTSQSLSKLFFWVNEHSFYPPSLYDYAGSAMAAALAHLAIPDSAKIFPAAGGVTETGTWSNTAVYGKGRKSTVNGSTLSAVVNGRAIAINYIVQDGTSGVFNLKIDGADYGNFNNFEASAMASKLGIPYGPACVLVDGLAPGSHTVLMTVISPTGANAAVYIDMIAGLGGNASMPIVIAPNCPRMSDAAYSAIGGSDAGVLRCNQIHAETVNRFKALGCNIYVPDYYSIDRACLDNSGSHFGNEGHRLMSLADLKALPA